MKRTLEMKEIVGYLPHDLKLLWECNYMKDVVSINFYSLVDEDVPIRYAGKKVSGGMSLRDVRPILRPMSDMVKNIKHKGKNLVPVCELAEQMWKTQYTDKTPVVWRAAIKVTEIGTYYYAVAHTEIGDYEFHTNQYGIPYFQLLLRQHPCGKCNRGAQIHTIPVWNQTELFDKLYEWMIDFRNLISAKLAESHDNYGCYKGVENESL